MKNSTNFSIGMTRTPRTQENREKFLATLQETANVSASCKAINIGRTTAYEWKAADLEFSRAWDQALESGLDALEAEARRRAFEGIEEPVFYRGQVCGYVRKYSDSLIMFLLKAYRHQFRDRVQVDVNELDRRFAEEVALLTAGGEGTVSSSTSSETVN